MAVLVAAIVLGIGIGWIVGRERFARPIDAPAEV
jgi:hypothetical protein